MATANNAYGVDPTDPYNQVRQRMLGQYQDPTVDVNPSTVPSSSAASPDFAPTPANGTAAGIQAPIQTASAGGPIQGTEPTQTLSTPNPMPTSFTNTSSVPSSTPTGIADPVHPGYDTAGFVLGSHYDPQGNLIIANPTTGQTATTPAGTLNTSFAPTPAAATPSTPTPAPGAGPGGVSAAPSAFTNQLRALILAQLAKAQGGVDPNSPEITSTLGAARDEASRATDQERAALAERLYAQGLGTGGSGSLGSNALTQQIQQSGERNATALSGLRANLLMNEYQQKQTQLQNLLQLAVQSGDSESARAVQAQIANLQAALSREGLGVNLAEFGQTLNQNAALAGLNG